MEIVIHRGIDQIGGCITEISTKKSKILIDLGQNLPDGNGNVEDPLANRSSIENVTKDADSILYTHYHGDHFGLFHLVPEEIPQYLGKVAKMVALEKYRRLSFIPGEEERFINETALIEKMNTFEANQEIQIGDIQIVPFFVSHSAYDAYMFLIIADGKRVLHTGDFRGHGYLSKGLLPTIQKHVLRRGKIDFLITEGTMLSRIDERVRHESELKKEAIELMNKYKYAFIQCSSTDMERLASFYAANKTFRNRPFVCDDFQSNVLKIFSDTAGKKSQLFNFEKAYTFWPGNSKLISWMGESGFCMLVRATDKYEKYLDSLRPRLKNDETVLIYSMWKEYVNPESRHANTKYLNFVNKFPRMERLHTSGHASADCLTDVCNLVNPASGIIPIHAGQSTRFKDLPISDELKRKVVTESTTIDSIEVHIA